MAGWSALGWATVGALVFAGGCQPLPTMVDDNPYVTTNSVSTSDGGGTTDAAEEGGPTGDVTDGVDDGGPTTAGPEPTPTGPCGDCDDVCVRKVWQCMCWGDDEFCDPWERTDACLWGGDCDGLAGDALATCIVDQICGAAGGSYTNGEVTCNDDSAACKGSCDDDPSLCDPDGDGVPTFACGDQQCLRDEYCYEDTLALPVPTYRCLDVPRECTGEGPYFERTCLGTMWCSAPNALGGGEWHLLTCEDGTDTG